MVRLWANYQIYIRFSTKHLTVSACAEQPATITNGFFKLKHIFTLPIS